MHRLMNLAAERLQRTTPVAVRVLDWQGDVSANGASVPLRLAAALHALVLANTCGRLKDLWPPHDPDDNALWQGVEHALHTHSAAIMACLDSPPQTNEIRRSAAIIPALHLIAKHTGLPLCLSELGASAGLNLLCDGFRLDLPQHSYGPRDAGIVLQPDWTGPAPPVSQLRVTDRAGVDLNPIDANVQADTLRLMSYLWPDQRGRLASTRKAVELARSSRLELTAADAINWLGPRLAQPRQNQTHVVFHTIAWQYFPASRQTQGARLLAKAGRRATSSTPLAHLWMEADAILGSAALALTLWPGGQTRLLARVDFHGRWVQWYQ